MAIANIGGGQQVGDGNQNEIVLGVSAAPQTATATATLTAAQITGNLLVGNPSTSAAAYTFPTGALLDAALGNAKVGSTFKLNIINLGTSSGVITLTASTGITIVGLATIAINLQAEVMFRRTDVATWVAYRVC